MWKKSDFLPESPSAAAGDSPAVTPSAPAAPRAATGHEAAASIGPSITIRGDLSGEEDLLIRGRVEGTISLPQNRVIVGEEGRVNANVFARTINVEGQVEGDLFGEEQVVVRRSGQVRGNIGAPRVTLEDGCRFKGSIDMDAKADDRQRKTVSLNTRSDAPQSARAESGNGQQPKTAAQAGNATSKPASAPAGKP